MSVASAETSAPSDSQGIPQIPEPGQVVEVRGSTWAVADVRQQGPAAQPG